MMGVEDAMSYFLRIKSGWRVCALDALGLSGGTLSACNQEVVEFKAYRTVAGILLEGRLNGFSKFIRILNIYAPYQNRRSFWEHIKSIGLL